MFGNPNISYPAAWYQQPAAQQQAASGIIWVQGKAGANSYYVGPEQSAMLMDSEDTVFYIKTADKSGMPLPLRTFRYKEIMDPEKHREEYITRAEFEKKIEELRNANTAVQPTE